MKNVVIALLGLSLFGCSSYKPGQCYQGEKGADATIISIDEFNDDIIVNYEYVLTDPYPPQIGTNRRSLNNGFQNFGIVYDKQIDCSIYERLYLKANDYIRTQRLDDVIKLLNDRVTDLENEFRRKKK